MDALHGTPVPRALVRLNARTVLSDAQGRFSFPQFSEPQGYVVVSKPGYADSSDATDGPAMARVSDLDATLELKLYPDALLVGTLTARDGSTLANVGVQLYRANYGPSGISAAQVRYTVTDSHGNYRFQEPAGSYRLVTRYVSSLPETGQAVLAAAFPGGSSALSSGFFALQAGEERRVNLRPSVGMPVPVELKIDGTDEDDRQARLRISVEAESEVPFSIQAQPEGTRGLYRITLPPGSYSIAATAGDRENPLEGTAHLTVSPRGSNHVELHFSEPALFPVEVSADLSAQSSGAQPQPLLIPTPAQLNLTLHSLTAGSLDGTADRRLQNSGSGYAFRVPAGRYRLVSSGSGSWVVESASLGAENLAGGDLTVAGSSAGTPIRIVVGTKTGQVTGTVAMGSAFSAWVYLIARAPALTPFYMERVGTAGSFSRSLPPGSYTVLAVENRLQQDLYDHSVIQALASAGKEVTIAAGTSVAVQVPLLAAPGGSR